MGGNVKAEGENPDSVIAGLRSEIASRWNGDKPIIKLFKLIFDS